MSRSLSRQQFAVLIVALMATGIGQSLVFAILPPPGREVDLSEIQITSIAAVLIWRKLPTTPKPDLVSQSACTLFRPQSFPVFGDRIGDVRTGNFGRSFSGGNTPGTRCNRRYGEFLSRHRIYDWTCCPGALYQVYGQPAALFSVCVFAVALVSLIVIERKTQN